MTSPIKRRTYTVQLALYDLSQGMARPLSAQFLGGPEHAIDIIPHTGVLVYGKEYFYGGGGGISVEDPHVFRTTRGMAPIQIITLSPTSVAQNEFEEWCLHQQNISGIYSGMSYDLFRHNCNHFSHDATLKGLKLTSGVPQYILDIPDRFLNSPMGQMMSPMLQGMQVGGNATPFSPSGQGMHGGTSIRSNTSHRSVAAAASSAAALPQPSNPWAVAGTSDATKAPASLPIHTPLLDKNSRSLLSNDTKTATICANKFSQHDAIQRVAMLISSNEVVVPPDLLGQACDALLVELREGAQLTFGVMLLRLFILRDTTNMTQTCTDWIASQLVKSDTALSDPARSMAWCCMSNFVARTASATMLNLTLLDAAFQDINSSKRPEVKQAAASYLYNLAIHICALPTVADDEQNGEEEPCLSDDAMVSLLCGALDGIHDETDDVTLKRRLLVVGRFVQHRKAAVQLVVDLGFDEMLRSLAISGGDTEELLDEILLLIGHVSSTS